MATSKVPGPEGQAPAPESDSGRHHNLGRFAHAGASRLRRRSSLLRRQPRLLLQNLAIEGLDLAPTAKNAAYELKKKHPAVIFTSGRRSKGDQARAMAGNVVQNRKWIEQTYAKSTAREKCQKWVDDNPDKKTKDEVETGLAGVLDQLTDAELALVSKHLSGDAFDVQPVDTDADKIKETLRDLTKDKGKFLDTEGGLSRDGTHSSSSGGKAWTIPRDRALCARGCLHATGAADLGR